MDTKHKPEWEQYFEYPGVENGLKCCLILAAISVRLVKLEDKMSFENKHENLNFLGMEAFKIECGEAFQTKEHLTQYFNHVEKKIKELKWTGIMLTLKNSML